MTQQEFKDKWRSRWEDMPICLNFSGGQTSGYMLYQMADVFGLENLVVCFANTGKEHDKTLEFVHRVDVELGGGIVNWIEFEKGSFRLVDYETAARNGEPFERMITGHSYLPNAVQRICTSELKIKPIKRFMRSLGFDHWYNCLGIRRDEPNRYARVNRSSEKERFENIAPLYEWGDTKATVDNWWLGRPFRLEIPNYLGNCDMCFLKSRNKMRRIIQEEPERLQWWSSMEEKTGATFNKRISYKQLQMLVNTQPELFDSEIEVDCFCNIQ